MIKQLNDGWVNNTGHFFQSQKSIRMSAIGTKRTCRLRLGLVVVRPLSDFQSRTNFVSDSEGVFLFLHFLFKDLTQNQERYWPNSDPNSQPLCMGLLQGRSQSRIDEYLQVPGTV